MKDSKTCMYFIQLLDLSESNITSNMAQQVILGEAVSNDSLGAFRKLLK